jgi:hypothetical protein
MTNLDKIFSAKKLTKPGGEVHRTIQSLPSCLDEEKIIAEAVKRGLGYRISHGTIRIFAPG